MRRGECFYDLYRHILGSAQTVMIRIGLKMVFFYALIHTDHYAHLNKLLMNIDSDTPGICRHNDVAFIILKQDTGIIFTENEYFSGIRIDLICVNIILDFIVSLRRAHKKTIS